jgi:hypothetical protein
MPLQRGLMQMDNFLYATLGWLFGLGGAMLIEVNQTKRFVSSLRKALRYELRETSNRYVAVAFTIAMRIRAADQDFLNWFLRAQEQYDGPARDEQIVEAARMAAANPQQIDAASRARHLADPKKSPALKKYPTPALDKSVEHIADFTRHEQNLVLEIRTTITMYEATVDDIRETFRVGFDSGLSEEAKNVIESNLLVLYIQAPSFSRRTVDLCNRLVYQRRPN